MHLITGFTFLSFKRDGHNASVKYFGNAHILVVRQSEGNVEIK